MNELFYIIKSLVMLVVVIGLANYFLKYLNRYQSQKNQQIQIIEKISVTKESAISIVKIGEQFYLMSFAAGKNEILKEFSQAEQESLVAKMTQNPPELGQVKQVQSDITKKIVHQVKSFVGKRPEK